MIDREDDTSRPANKSAPKRKGPIVNQRGPSELSRAIQMMSNLGVRSGQGRKPGSQQVGKGTVVKLDRSKGYGFLVDSSGEQRFFHRSAVLEDKFDALQEQQAVDFEPYSDERGARAQKVRPAGTAVRPESTRPAKASSPRTPKAPAWKSDLSPFRNGSAPTPSRKRPKI